MGSMSVFVLMLVEDARGDHMEATKKYNIILITTQVQEAIKITCIRQCVRSILLLPLVVRCLETIDVCIWRMFVFMSVVVTVWGSVEKFVVQWPLLKIVGF